MTNFILADGRWSGMHGIGRFSSEVLSRLKNTDILTEGPKPLSIQNLFWQSHYLYQCKKKYKLFFSPGFNPTLYSSIPFVFTIHDLIHLYSPTSTSFIKKMYYQFLMKPAARSAYKILTVSEFSKKTILEWANLPDDKVINVSGGVSKNISHDGPKHTLGYPYLLHVGNAKKTHKNVARLLTAFANAKIDKGLCFIFTGELSSELIDLIRKYHLENRIIVQTNLSDVHLAEYYRGAVALIYPSLYEGFGLPVLEGMASGVPVLTSNVTSMPEIAGDAALLVDPFETDSITAGIEKIISDSKLRETLVQRGFERAGLFSWDKTAQEVQRVLDGK